MRHITRMLHINHNEHVAPLLRGFPDNLINKIRHQPSTALLAQMHRRFSGFSLSDFSVGTEKCNYVTGRLSEEIRRIGTMSGVKNYWLFPILVVSLCIVFAK